MSERFEIYIVYKGAI